MNVLAIAIYCLAIVVANLSVAALGPWVSPFNSFLLIGLDLTLRDRLHDAWAGRKLWLKMSALILVASAISYAVNPAAGRIALASFLAFAIAGAVDAVAYHLLRGRSYMQRTNGSNAAGALTDSILFVSLAFDGFRPAVIGSQFAAKFVGGFVWSKLLRRTFNPRRSNAL